MATFALGFDPVWYIADLVGNPLGGGSLESFQSQDKSLHNPIFSDPGGTLPYTNPIEFDNNGSVNTPFYFTTTANDPNNTYFLVVKDAQGNLVWSMDGYQASGSGGGGSITTNNSLQNYITNGSFLYSTTSPIVNPNATGQIVAPGNYQGITPGTSSTDNYYFRVGGTTTDTITFTPFTAGTKTFFPDQTPVQYLNYTTTGAPPVGESNKAILYTVTRGLQTLEGETMTISVWARANSTNQTVTVGFYQFFGSGGGGAASAFSSPIKTETLTAGVWTKIVATGTVPAAGGSIGANQDDALYVYFGYPTNVSCNIDHTKMSLYLGSNAPNLDYQSNDFINAISSGPRPGDIKTTMSTFAPNGWLQMNDQTIGNPSSGATNKGYDLFPLFDAIWRATNGHDNFAPVLPSRGASSAADFAAGKSIQLLYSLGATLGNVGVVSTAAYGVNQTGTNWALGTPNGEEVHPLTIGEMPAHTHNLTIPDDGAGTYMSQVTATVNRVSTATSSTGGGISHNTIQPTLRVNYFIKK